jgi:acyl-CoA hydrolase
MSSELSRRAAERARQITERVTSPAYQTRLHEAVDRAAEYARNFDPHPVIEQAARAAERVRETYGKSGHSPADGSPRKR